MQRYWRLTRSLTMGAQGVVMQADTVLLVRHTYRPGWHFPGGGIEKNETALATLKRELQEEAGVIVERMPKLFGLFANFDNFPSDHIALYLVPDWRQPAIPHPNREIAEVGFFSTDNLPDGCASAIPRRLEEIAGRRPMAERW